MVEKLDGWSTRACLKNHSCNLHTSIYGIFCLHSVTVARYAALIQAKSPANCDAHLAESIFQTRSRARIECEPLREHSSHSDRVTNIGLLLSLGASYLLHKFRIFKLFFFARRMEAILFFSILVTISVKPKYSFPKLIKAGRTSEAIPCCCHFFRIE